jgi:ABC-2 type transport system permease protein
VRGTPLPPATFVAGRVGNSLVISVIMVALISVIGALVYGVTIPTHTMPAMLVTLAVGAFSFSCLGFALAAVIPTADAAPAVTNATVLPLYFLSGVFIPQNEIPDGVLNFADAFPIRHFFEAMFTAWDPNTTGSGFELGHLAVVAAWGLLGLAIAIRFFRWEPRR